MKSAVASPFRERLRAALSRYVEAPSVWLFTAMGLTANGVTLLGLVVGLAAAALAGAGWLLAAALVFLAASLLDMLDGALARQSGQASKFGALLDSTVDRLSEGALLLGLGVYAVRAGLSEGRTVALVALLIATLLCSQMVSYVRARGEGLGVVTKEVGLLTRAERVALFALGLALQGLGLDPALEVALGVVAALSIVTLAQRLLHVRHELKGG
ncbi:MAG: CDP-alcohol phosphatidyltransferase family protein [Chloroflexota bacterium]|nr:CDP-alcohol phosphatidyltransferase family protein [Chloroflexota bacterium]